MIDNDREKVAKVKGKVGLAEFDKRIEKKHYFPTKLYPIEESLIRQKTAAEIIYGKTDAEAYRKLGIWDYKLMQDTQIGKVIFKLFSSTLEKTIENFKKLMETFYTGLNCDIENMQGNKADFVFGNDPYPETYFQGLIEEGVRSFQKIPQIKIEQIGVKRIFHLTWE
ncbi:hypothetical protein A2X44_04810 [candidate division CPR3 bacterium GWF2_35_18]|nr:MAG: hypothetical protein A2X44_04810 [candidate division CPR3 bacterium GWF2_35_18]OGB65025.1 MAG: hypothetical protein A2250_01230 [candidate division CPR3 bacterium RIFOXYA2_FULL_35_13]OGB79545.1 MAG: hypothetical protein A2296_04470 [candidate division CPR3 bacterium RIFOXYB2_FULL_35_8]